MENNLKVGGGSVKTQTKSQSFGLSEVASTWINMTFDELTEVYGISSFTRSGTSSHLPNAQCIGTEANARTNGLTISGNVVSFICYNRASAQTVTFTITAVGK